MCEINEIFQNIEMVTANMKPINNSILINFNNSCKVGVEL